MVKAILLCLSLVVAARCFHFNPVLESFIVRNARKSRRSPGGGRGFGRRPSQPSKQQVPSSSGTVNSPAISPPNKDIVLAVPPNEQPYRGPIPEGGVVTNVIGAVEIEAYGVIVEVGESVVVPSERGLFVRLSPSGALESSASQQEGAEVTRANEQASPGAPPPPVTLPSGTILGSYAAGGELRASPPQDPNDPSSDRVVHFSVEGDPDSTTVLYDGQVVRLSDLLRPLTTEQPTYFGLTSFPGRPPAQPSRPLSSASQEDASGANAVTGAPGAASASAAAAGAGAAPNGPRRVLSPRPCVGAAGVAGHRVVSAAATSPNSGAELEKTTWLVREAEQGHEASGGSDDDGVGGGGGGDELRMYFVPPPPPKFHTGQDVDGGSERSGQEGGQVGILSVGQFANDLAVPLKIQEGEHTRRDKEEEQHGEEEEKEVGGRVVDEEEAYEKASEEKNACVLVWRLEPRGRQAPPPPDTTATTAASVSPGEDGAEAEAVEGAGTGRRSDQKKKNGASGGIGGGEGGMGESAAVILWPTFPVLAIRDTITLDNLEPMEVGCRYGASYWKTTGWPEG